MTLGKFGPIIGIDRVETVLRLNNICNDLGFDTASTGSAIAWAMELYQRGIITRETTGGLDLTWGNAEVVERLLFMMAVREGFGNVIADGTRAVEKGHYPAEALKYRMAVKGLMQSDPHDARILKAFALGLAVATRGMDHLRNRVTLEINAKINDDPASRNGSTADRSQPRRTCTRPRSGPSARARTCTPSATRSACAASRRSSSTARRCPATSSSRRRLSNVTGLEFTEAGLAAVGLNIMGVERLINHRLGVRRRDDTLPDRWFDEPVTAGPFAGEKIDRAEFDAMLSRFYEISELTGEGVPAPAFRSRLEAVLQSAAPGT